jgi:hypothetical protein
MIAGPPDLVDEQQAFAQRGDPRVRAALGEQDEALQGRKGALLWVVSASNGKKMAEYRLESLPAWDGMAVARGRLYLSTADGNVLCFGST